MRLKAAAVSMLAIGVAALAGLGTRLDWSENSYAQVRMAQAQAKAPDAELNVALNNTGRIPNPVDAGSDTRTETTAELPAERRATVSVSKGDTLMDLLLNADVPQGEAHAAIEALRGVYDPRKLRVGQEISLTFERVDGTEQLRGFEMATDVVHTVVVLREADGGFAAEEQAKEVTRETLVAQGQIQSSLFEAASRMGVPHGVLVETIRAFSYDVDFQRDIQPGDRFAIMYERDVTEDGQVAGEGNIQFAMLSVGGKDIPIYRYQTKDGTVDYYTLKGQSVRKALLRTPVDGARLTSGFGMRKHPILGYSKMHAGVDFGAPTGTPVYAAGDGTIDMAGKNGGYGNYIRLRHNNEIATAYAHLNGFAKGIKAGTRVKQGQVIGYVGSTGRSTGPHLHYEILRHGKAVNPLSITVPTGRALDGKELAAFKEHVRKTDAQFQSLQQAPQVAESPAGRTATP